MFGFFTKKKGNEETTRQENTGSEHRVAPGTEIRFDPGLVDKLKAEHRSLLKLYSKISRALAGGNFDEVSEALGEIKGLLQGHLLTENVRLYVYLEHQFAGNEVNMELIRDFRREMDGIGRAVLTFLKKYKAIGSEKELAATFEKDLESLGKILSKRIQHEEETLYPLYMGQ